MRLQINREDDLCEINTHIGQAFTLPSPIPCSVLVIWSRYQTARRSFQIHWSSIHCQHSQAHCLSEHLHISYLCHTQHSIHLKDKIQKWPEIRNKSAFAAAADLHQERAGPHLEHHHRWPLKPRLSVAQPQPQLSEENSSIKVNRKQNRGSSLSVR